MSAVIKKINIKKKLTEHFTEDKDNLTLQWGEASIVLSKNGEIELKNKYASLSLSNLGEILVQGQQISSHANQDISIKSLGGNISLDTEKPA